MTIQKILGFKELERGWHYGEGVPIGQPILDYAIALNGEAFRFGFLETDAFPGINGEVMFTIYSGDDHLEFMIEPNGTITFSRERGDEEVSYEEGLTFQQATEKISQFAAEKR